MLYGRKRQAVGQRMFGQNTVIQCIVSLECASWSRNFWSIAILLNNSNIEYLCLQGVPDIKFLVLLH